MYIVTYNDFLLLCLSLQKLDADLMFEENLISDYKSSKIIDDSPKVRIVSKRSVNDATSDSTNISHETQEVGWWSRVKRAIVNFFSSDDNEETPSVVQKQPSPALKLDELETLPVAEKLQKVESVRPRRQHLDHNDDDEDDNDDEDEEEGSTSNPVESTPISSLPSVDDDKYFRLKIDIHEFWNDAYKNKSSKEFSELSVSLGKGLEELYHKKTDKKIMARVVEMR